MSGWGKDVIVPAKAVRLRGAILEQTTGRQPESSERRRARLRRIREGRRG